MLSPISPTKHVAGRLEATTRVSSSTKKYGRGIRAAILSVICAAVGVSGAHATTVSWGSEIRSVFRDSAGNALDATFTVQLGFFANSFTPDDTNVAAWGSNWRVFDQAVLNLGLNPETNDHFTSQAELNANGTSSYQFASTGVDFQFQTAYIWIRNSTNPVPGTEWFLATAPAWIFPEGIDDCCDPDLDVQFSVTDLNAGSSVTPVWGSQSFVSGYDVNGDPIYTQTRGDGAYTVTNPLYDLQTYTFLVPEPSSLLLTLAGSCLLLIRRRPAA